jgi:cold shock CspA family protein
MLPPHVGGDRSFYANETDIPLRPGAPTLAIRWARLAQSQRCDARRALPDGTVFVHVRTLQMAGLPEPQLGDNFEFELVPSRNGKAEAGNLRRVFA